MGSGVLAASCAEGAVRLPSPAGDLDEGALGQGGDADRGAGRRVGGEELGVGVVDGGELAQLGRVDRQPQGALQARAAGEANGLQVLQAAARLLCRGLAGHLAAVGVER
jgi:hypothetical protein